MYNQELEEIKKEKMNIFLLQVVTGRHLLPESLGLGIVTLNPIPTTYTKEDLLRRLKRTIGEEFCDQPSLITQDLMKIYGHRLQRCQRNGTLIIPHIWEGPKNWRW